jgi:hypothetical protein
VEVRIETELGTNFEERRHNGGKHRGAQLYAEN